MDMSKWPEYLALLLEGPYAGWGGAHRLGETMGVHDNLISAWKRGTSAPNIANREKLGKLARGLKRQEVRVVDLTVPPQVRSVEVVVKDGAPATPQHKEAEALEALRRRMKGAGR